MHCEQLKSECNCADIDEEAIVDCEDPPEKRKKNFRMSKKLHAVCKDIDKAVRKMIDSHKGKGLVDYAHTNLFDTRIQ